MAPHCGFDLYFSDNEWGTEVKKERYKHLNAECQTIIRRDKKDFLRNQCKEIRKKAINAVEGVEKRETSYTVGGNAN